MATCMPEPYYDCCAFARAIAAPASMLRRVSVSSNDIQPASSASRLSRSASEIIAAAITVLAVLVYVQSAWAYRNLFLGNAVDDAYISFRYLENLATGHGLTYNPGERVEGFSNLLWIVVLLPFRLAGIDVVFASQALGVTFGVLTIALGVFSARRLFSIHSPMAITLVAFLPASSGYFAAWSIGGLEGSLYAFLLIAAWFRYHLEAESPNRRPLSALLFVALAMTRPEGVFVALAAVGYHLAIARTSGKTLRDPAVWRFVVVLLVLIGLYELFRVVQYGPHLFPNSVRAKVGLSQASILRGITYVHERFASPYLVLLAPLLFILRRNRHPALLTASVIVGASVGLVVAAGGDWSVGRLFAPIVPLGAIALVGAAAEVSQADSSWKTLPSQTIVGAAVAAYLIFASHVTNTLGEAQFFRDYAHYDAERILIGKWLRDHAPKNAKVAVYAAGQIPYFSGLYAHDMLGLNDAHIAAIDVRTLGKGIVGHEKSDPDYTLRVIKPDIIIDGQLVPGLLAHPDFEAKYELLSGFRHNSVYVKEELVEVLTPPVSPKR